jgi:predicted transglutaminase-like cysteine proteinase
LQRNASYLSSVDALHWNYLASKAPVMDEMLLLRTVNAFFNKFPYVSDKDNYGVIGYWPTLREILHRRSGDCKAYVLTKYFALRALGLDDDKLRIVVMHVPKTKTYHAVVAVNTAKGIFILDNVVRPKDLILPQEKLTSQYVPLYKFNTNGRWTFKQNLNLLIASRRGQ